MDTWHVLLLVVAYGSAVSCVYAALRIGLASGWGAGLRQLLVFLAFVLLYYLLESWAHHRVPYYHYPPVFPDMVPTFPWDAVPGFPGPAPSACTIQPPPDAGISLLIPLLEASLTFSVMWTARLLAVPVLLQPFLAGLVHLALDGFLDPVIAWSYDCAIGEQIETGLGFWHWYVTDRLGPDWFGIPLFNFAAWYAAPVILVSLAYLARWIRAYLAWRAGSGSGGPPAPSPLEGAFLTIVSIGFSVLFLLAPTYPWPIEKQGLLLLLFVLLTLAAVVWHIPVYVHDNPFRWEFVFPQLAGLVYPLLAMILNGHILAIPYLWIVALVTVPLVLYYSISPYLEEGS